MEFCNPKLSNQTQIRITDKPSHIEASRSSGELSFTKVPGSKAELSCTGEPRCTGVFRSTAELSCTGEPGCTGVFRSVRELRSTGVPRCTGVFTSTGEPRCTSELRSTELSEAGPFHCSKCCLHSPLCRLCSHLTVLGLMWSLEAEMHAYGFELDMPHHLSTSVFFTSLPPLSFKS